MGGEGARQLRRRPPVAGEAAPPALLADPEFRRFAVIQVTKQIAIWLELTAVTVLLLRLTDNGVIVTASTVVHFAPVLVVGSWMGLLSDRGDRRRLLVVLATSSGVVGALLLATVATGRATWPLLLLLSFASGSLYSAEHPVRRAIVSDLVDRDVLTRAVGLNAAFLTGARMVGPALAGILIAGPGISWCLFVSAVGVLVQPLLLLRLHPRRTGPTELGPRGQGQVRAGFRYVRADRPVADALVLVGAAAVMTINLSAIMALFVSRDLGGADTTYTVLWTFLGIGSVAGAALVPAVAGSLERLAVRSVQVGLALGVLAAAPNLWVAGATLVGVGVLGTQVLSGGEAHIQLRCQPAVLGRVVGLVSIVTIGAPPLVAPVLGFVAEVAGARWSLLLLALLDVGCGLLVRRSARRAVEV